MRTLEIFKSRANPKLKRRSASTRNKDELIFLGMQDIEVTNIQRHG